jgi:multiple sugar transport system substrate-binding protein
MPRSNPSTRRRAAMAVPVAVALVLAACGDDDDDGAAATTAAAGDTAADTSAAAGSGGSLQVMIGSSGDAETNAVNAATERFTEASGTSVEVIPAQDLSQQLTQGFAGGNPPDVFYVDPVKVVQYGEAGSLFAYGDQIADVDDIFPALRESYTIDGQLYCAPKDYGTLALVINTDAWTAAGLTEADYPTTWEELSTVSTALTTGDQTGLVFDGTRDRVGAFLLQGGGWILNDDQTEATANSPENVAALTYLQENIEAGNFQFTKQIEAQWGGEALGSGRAAMTIEGPWIAGAMENDFPDVNWTAVELPAGPGGQGTLQFSNCWGIAEASDNKEAAVALVEHLISAEEQQAFAEAFGPTPSRESLADWFTEQEPELAPFIAGVDYSHSPVTAAGFDSVMQDFDAQLEALGAGSASPEEVLERLQSTSEEALAGG